jgi:flagellar protein FliO/FliZ
MPVKTKLCWLLLLWLSGGVALAGTDIPKQAIRTLAFGDIAKWGLSLLMVLSVFLLCVWGMYKLTALAVGGTDKMRVVGGLSLGRRERVLLLQVGKKQLVLGVTPGRIETLHVLEGDDCLAKEATVPAPAPFAQTLLQAITARAGHNRSGGPDA